MGARGDCTTPLITRAGLCAGLHSQSGTGCIPNSRATGRVGCADAGLAGAVSTTPCAATRTGWQADGTDRTCTSVGILCPRCIAAVSNAVAVRIAVVVDIADGPCAALRIAHMVRNFRISIQEQGIGGLRSGRAERRCCRCTIRIPSVCQRRGSISGIPVQRIL